MDERVIVVSVGVIDERVGHRSIVTDSSALESVLKRLVVRERAEVETDAGIKQLVVYAIIRSKNRYFTYRRSAASAEHRLAGVCSIGVGGHVDAFDTDDGLCGTAGLTVIQSALRREMREELDIRSEFAGEPELVGLINDDSSPVGSVHLGVMWLVDLEGDEVICRQGSGMQPLGFGGIQTLHANKADFEPWSQMLIDYIASGGMNKYSSGF